MWDTLNWFRMNLPVPRRLPPTAVCWFRADAAESLDRLWTLVELYRLVGHTVWRLSTQNPGRIVYRDAWQVAAVPYRDQRVKSTAM